MELQKPDLVPFDGFAHFTLRKLPTQCQFEPYNGLKHLQTTDQANKCTELSRNSYVGASTARYFILLTFQLQIMARLLFPNTINTR